MSFTAGGSEMMGCWYYKWGWGNNKVWGGARVSLNVEQAAHLRLSEVQMKIQQGTQATHHRVSFIY